MIAIWWSMMVHSIGSMARAPPDIGRPHSFLDTECQIANPCLSTTKPFQIQILFCSISFHISFRYNYTQSYQAGPWVSTSSVVNSGRAAAISASGRKFARSASNRGRTKSRWQRDERGNKRFSRTSPQRISVHDSTNSQHR